MRAAALLAATVALLWLALPALVSPASVASTIREEDRLHAAWLGETASHGILRRALGWIGQASSDTSRRIAPDDSRPDDPLSARFAAATDAVARTTYLQSVRTLARLAAYRLAALAEWLALGWPFLVAATVDGAVMRTVQLRAFAHLSPVLFGIGLHGTLAVLACTALALLLPVGVHPLVWGGLIGAFAATLRTTVVNFHRVR
jgi:hypothetical protein